MNGRKFSSCCGHCGQRAMELVVVPYVVRVDHDGRKYEVVVPALSVPRCANCGTLSLDNEADQQISSTFRQQAGLLSPEEIGHQRNVLGLSQEALAAHLGVAVTTLSRWETGGQIQPRSLDKLLRLYFGLPAARDFLTAASVLSFPEGITSNS